MPAYISSIGTAVPKNKISQKRIAEFMTEYLPLEEHERHQVEVIYRASGIKERHTVIEDYSKTDASHFRFYPQNQNLEPFPTVRERMTLYQAHALPLAREAVENCLEPIDANIKEITHLITVSCTGMYAPGLDIELVETLEMATDIERTSINFMGCYAAFNAVKVANQIARNEPNAKVLVVAVELCSIHMQKTTDEDSLLSNALFADGAAALWIESNERKSPQLRIDSQYSDLALDGKDRMSWDIGDHGFLMRLSPKVPETIREGIAQLTSRLLEKLDLKLSDIDAYAIHPGGKRILSVIEQELGISKDQNQQAYDVLRHYGNMSSPTVLFVLKELMKQPELRGNGKRILSFAFGPGLTLESLLYTVA